MHIPLFPVDSILTHCECWQPMRKLPAQEPALPPPMRISCYCLDHWGYVVCNNKREGAFPRFLTKIPSTKRHVLSMYTNIMDAHECINMWHCLNFSFDFYIPQDLVQLKETHVDVYLLWKSKRDVRQNVPAPLDPKTLFFFFKYTVLALSVTHYS